MGAADSKLAFKKSVFRLFEERSIPPSANDYWEQFWTLPESADDVFLLVGSQDIRRVRSEAHENLECLVDKILGHLFRLCGSPQFMTPHAPAIQVLNCVRVLTRILPFIFESEELMQWEERYFWTPHTVVASSKGHPAPLSGAKATPVPECEIQPMPHLDQPDPITGTSQTDDQLLKLEERAVPLRGQRLIKTLLDLLFTSGFTLPTALETKTRVSHVIWDAGIGSSKAIGSSKELDDNRTEILRLLLVLFSRSMYISPAAITTTENRWIDAVVTGSDRQATLAILCSLINSALKYNPSGWGLPYNHVVFSDQKELLVMLSLQTIVVLLDYYVIEHPQPQSPSLRRSEEHARVEVDQGLMTSASSSASSPAATTVALATSSAQAAGAGITNQFRYYLSRLHREQDFAFLTDGLYRILSNPMAASSTYLPGSTKQVKCYHETLMLCWKTLELNKRFRTYLLETNRVLDIVVILLYFSLEHKLDTSHIGLVRMCAYMLQTLSKDRAFGHCLNRPFDGHGSLPANVKFQGFHGSYGDYLICSVHHLISTTKRTLRSLYPALISTLSNVSSCIKNLSPLASSRLLQLTTSFASPSFLLAEEGNHELLGILLDSVCSMLYYQAPDNPHLIYTLIQYEPKFQTMARFTLQRGLADIHKLRYHKQEIPHTSLLSSESGQARTPDNHLQRSISQRPNSQQSGIGEPSTGSLHFNNRDNTTLTESSLVSGPSSWSIPQKSSDSVSPSSRSLSPHRREVFCPRSGPLVMPALVRPDSSDSIIAPPSDGGGHDGDVEDEGGPSTVLKSPKDRSIHALSEKARGKLPEKEYQSSSSSTMVREESSCELESDDTRSLQLKRMPSLSKLNSAAYPSRPPLSARNSNYSSYQQGKTTTTAHDVGLNGFIPTEEWVQGWMKTLRFEPLLIMLQCTIPEIESIRAMNDHQVLEHIRTNIIPVLIKQVLPESGKPPIIVRKFTWIDALVVWFQGLLWSQIYVGGCGRLGRQGMGVWYDTGVQLFCIRTVTSMSAASVAAAAISRVAGSTFATPTAHSTASTATSHQQDHYMPRTTI
ncbi:hypothetical protein KVV02_006117 [Mortierella alpina]|uniref:High-temperature-induced dauer-formation protein n=1 Tax=Mortierella alpina TaxID=64518 RepID=A0A9P7ZYB7_MORAP|nr:hypothetical protein KVV02_006117 [Mortierella alpina]